MEKVFDFSRSGKFFGPLKWYTDRTSFLAAENSAELRRTQHNLIEWMAFEGQLCELAYELCLNTEHSYGGKVS
jgi:hypothetical protein